MQSTLVGACNDGLLFPRCVASLREEIQCLNLDEPGDQGLAVVVDHQILLRKKPAQRFAPVDMLEDLHTNLFMSVYKTASTGEFNSDDIHPLRYRGWVFSMSGPIPEELDRSDGPLSEGLPSFLEESRMREVYGATLFSYFVGALYESGLLDAVNDQKERVLECLTGGMDRFRVLSGMQAIPFSFTLMRKEFAVGFVGECGVQRLDLQGLDRPVESSDYRQNSLDAYVKKVILASTEKELPAPWVRLDPSQLFLLGKDGSWVTKPAFA